MSDLRPAPAFLPAAAPKPDMPIFAAWWADLDRCLSDLSRRGSRYRDAKTRYEWCDTPENAANVLAKQYLPVEAWT